ncbi:hypothetical protein ACLKA6_002099 [Drosophila palustris]
MPELLQGTALMWYIANNEHWRTWTSFIGSFQEFFLPRDYFSKLLEKVTRRKKGIDEPFKMYMENCSLIELMQLAEEFEELERDRETSGNTLGRTGHD